MASDRDADGYVDIDSYGALGDGRTIALVARDGRVDWWPVMAADEPPTFAAVLDPQRGGHLALAPTAPFRTSRRYLPGTNVLETTFTTDAGAVRVLDAVSFGKDGRLPWGELVRQVSGIDGEVEMAWRVQPGTKFGEARPWVECFRDDFVLHTGDEVLAVRTFDVGSPAAVDDGVQGTFVARSGSEGLLAVLGATEAPVFFPDRDQLRAHLDHTVNQWRTWLGSFCYEGPWKDAVQRSALALKLLVCASTGAILAAPTTSLPERVGGDKNWDYRFMWIRDSSFSIEALLSLRLSEEAQSAVQWMLGALRRTTPDLNVMYTLEGGDPPQERQVDLPGYRCSQPVRLGNGASNQTQLGTYGDLFDTIWRYAEDGHRIDTANGRMLADLADRCCDLWQREDAGIWELQQQRHYTISKIGCWTALDRAVRLAEQNQVPTMHVERWARERDRIRGWVHEHCWSDKRSSYTFYAGTDDLDAATLLAARTGFDRGERLAGTVRAVQSELADGAYVYRYSGARKEEGAFLACTYWLVNALTILGETEEARTLMETAIGLGNDLGLLAEQADPKSGKLLGNFPQGLSHLALINAACALRDADDDQSSG